MLSISLFKLINILVIALGIGVSSLCFIEVKTFTQLKDEVKLYFRFFFLGILIYITAHLAREIMEGLPGSGIALALKIVSSFEMAAAGLMAMLFSGMLLSVAEPKRHYKAMMYSLIVLFCVHTVFMMLSGMLGTYVFYFDSQNIYHRGSLYLLSNTAPILMIAFDFMLLIRYKDKFIRKIYISFWNYLITPLVAMIIQSFFYGLQLIIFTTVGAAVYMFTVIVSDLTARYQKQKLESSRLETELSLANRIQADMLPNIFPAFPDRKEFDIHACMTPAKEVGGDFYDFFFVDHDHLGIVMADVSGKGVPAALFMMISKILVQNFAVTGHSPEAVLEAVNNQICLNNREEMFVTVWLGVLDVKTGKLVAANAGHEYPALKTKDGDFELVKDEHGLPVGTISEAKYKKYELQLEEGSKLFLYTDGVAEASDDKNELYGTDRMLEALRKAENKSPKEILEAMDSSLNAFVKNAPQFDDVTMLCLQYKGQ